LVSLALERPEGSHLFIGDAEPEKISLAFTWP
jgi:hypothetical protein